MRAANALLPVLLLAFLLAGPFACRTTTPLPKNDEPLQQVKFIGCSTTMVFHEEDCRYCDAIKPENRVEFSSIEEALNAGYTPCKVCKPDDNRES